MPPDATSRSLSSPEPAATRWFLWFCVALVVMYVGVGVFIGVTEAAGSPATLLADAKQLETAPGYDEGRAAGAQNERRGVSSPSSHHLETIARQACPAALASSARVAWVTAFKAGFRAAYRRTSTSFPISLTGVS